MKKAIAAFAAVALSGCVIAPSTPVIGAQLNAVQGQPVTMVLGRLGYPTGESQVAGTKFYYWSTSGVVMEPTPIETSGIVQEGHKTVSYDQTTYAPDHPVPVACSIRVFVDPYERIIAHDVSGDQRGCTPYAEKLDPNYLPVSHFIWSDSAR